MEHDAMRISIFSLQALLVVVAAPLCAQGLPDGGWTPLTYDDTKAHADNPLKGFVPFSGEYDFPHSMEFDYVGFATLMSGPTTFTFNTGLEPLLNEIAGRGHQAVIRVFLDYPDEATSIPQFLIDDGLQLTPYNGSSGAGMSPDYDDENLVQALVAFIAAFGARYDGDPRIGFVQLGLLGHWGEWHTYPEEELFPSVQTQNRILDAYDSAFNKTHLLISQDVMSHAPMATLGTRQIGFHDDDFANSTLPTEDYHFWSRMVANDFDQRWKTLPNGGEVQPDYQQVVFDLPTEAPEDFASAVTTTHVSWLLYHQAFEGENGGSNGWNEAKIERAMIGAKLTGYEFFISQANLPQTTEVGPLALGVRIQNRGVAPFYYNWPFEITAKRNGEPPVVLPTPDWAIGSVTADGADREFTLEIANHGLTVGDYAIHLKLPNPLPEGIPIRFANAAQSDSGVLLGTLTVGTGTGTGAEGEGEGEGDLEDIADDLLTDFDDLDSNDSGGLSLAEARIEVAALTQVQFNLIDTNGNGELSESELEAQLPDEEPRGCNLPAGK
jgi:hypothetical protein